MAQIKYLDSRRIMGASNDIVENLNYVDENYSSSTGWTQVSTNIAISNGKVQFSSGLTATSRIYKALPFTADNTKWIIDFELLYSTAGNGDQIAPLCISDGTDHPTGSATNSICVHSYHNGAGVTNDTVSVSYRDGGSLTNVFQLGTNLTNGTRYYMRLERTSSTNVKLTAYSNSARTSSVTTNNGTIPSTLDGLTTIHHSSHHTTGAAQTAEIDNLKFYDGVTGTPFTVTYKPAPALSLSGCKAYYNFEQTSAPSPDYETDFSSSTGWTQTGTKIGVANNTLEWDGAQNGSVHGSTIDLTSINTKAFFRAKLRINTLTAPSSASNFILIGFSDSDHTTAGDSNQDGIGLIIQNDTGTNSFRAMHVDGAPFSPNAGTAFATVPATATDYFIEVVLNVNTWYVRIYSDSSYSTLIEEETGSITATGLRYFGIKMRSSVNVNGTFNGYIDDFKFYNGVSSLAVPLTNIATTGNGFTDGLGSSAHGTNNGATTGATGKVGSYAWSFDGSNDYVDLGTPILGASGTTTASFSFWNNLSSTGFVYTDGNYDSTSTWATTIEQLTNGNVRLFIASSGADGGGNHVDSNVSVSAGWNHWVLTYDGSGSTNTDKIKIYLNGAQVSTTATGTIASSIKTVTPNARIGALYTGSGNYFGGLIDELAIFNRVLTSSEISLLYNSGTGKAVNDSSLQAKPETNSIFIETDTAYRYWFNGSEWKIPYLAGASTGFSAGGSTSLWTANTNHETYNGSTWSSATALTAGRQRITGVGGSSNHLVAGGDTAGTTNTQTTTYVWNGSSWSTGGALSQKRQFNPIGGTTTNTIVMGGETPEISQPNQLNSVESYNGTSWTTEASMSAASSGHSGSGTRQNAWWAGGYTHPNYLQTSQEYNGTAWTTRTSLPAKRANNAGGVGFKDSSLFTAGYDGVSVYQTTTYFYDGTAWSTKGAFPIGSGYVHMGGNPDNALQTSAYYNTWYQTNAYKFNGSTWSSTGSRSTGTTTGACGGG